MRNLNCEKTNLIKIGGQQNLNIINMSLSFTRVDDYGIVTDSTRGVILKTKSLGTPYAINAENITIYFADILFTLGIVVADISTIGGIAPANTSEAVSSLAPIFAGSTPTVKVIVCGDCN